MPEDSAPSLQDDIAYMKALAAEGRAAPLTGGPILVAAGAIFGAASFAHYLVADRLVAVPPSAILWIWLAAFVVFGVVLTVLIRRLSSRTGARTAADRAASTAWMGVGLSIFVMSLSISAIAWRIQDDTVTAVFPSLILALYGCGWAVSGAMSGVKWFWRLAIGAWIGAPILGLMTGMTEQYLAYAIAVLALTVLPGLAMMKAARDHG